MENYQVLNEHFGQGKKKLHTSVKWSGMEWSGVGVIKCSHGSHPTSSFKLYLNLTCRLCLFNRQLWEGVPSAAHPIGQGDGLEADQLWQDERKRKAVTHQ